MALPVAKARLGRFSIENFDERKDGMKPVENCGA